MAPERCPVCWRETCSCNSGGELIGTVFIFVVIPVFVVSLSSITDIRIGIPDQPIQFKLTQQFPSYVLINVPSKGASGWAWLLGQWPTSKKLYRFNLKVNENLANYLQIINNFLYWSWGWTFLRSSCMRTTTAAQLIKTLPFSKWPERSNFGIVIQQELAP